MAAGLGFKTFETGDVLTAAQVNTFLMQQTVMVFASSAARTSALSGVLAEGMVSYLQDTNSLEVYDGSAWVGATGDITAFYSSDIRLKENIHPILHALEKVKSISGNTYDWKAGFDEIHSHKGNDIGVIAQEIEAVLPQIVTNRDNGYKAVQYEKIIPLLVEAIKELSAKIDRLENK
jgi:hypothetical protein